MIGFIKKLTKFTTKIGKHFFAGEFSLAFYNLSLRVPNEIFVYNKSFILENNISSVKVPDDYDPAVNVKIAGLEDIESIAHINEFDHERIKSLIDSGALCFMSSFGEASPASVTWLSFGRCYIRGMGYEFVMPDNAAYGFFSATLPEHRKKGLYLQTNKAIVDYAKDQGVDTYVALAEFTNTYSIGVIQKLGLAIQLELMYVRTLFFRLSIQKNKITNKTRYKFFVSEPKGDVTII